jgi:mRNA-degrading endonuclease RelE of RelBE toxin-antitoxin system
MAFRIVPTEDFVKSLKQISKNHQGIFADIAKLSIQLKENPTMGTDLGHNLYKIRLSVSGTNKGKSGGARIITYIVLINETIYLAEIYLKSSHDSVDVDVLIQRLKDQGLI